MKQYYFNVTNEERENILDKHKTTYDGYVTEYGNGNNMTPLYVVDMAKDKDGVTVNNKGEVSGYKNFGINESINEMRHDNKSTGLFSNEEDDYSNPKAEKTAKSDIKKHFNKAAKRPFHYEEDPSEDWPKHEVDYDTEFDFELDEQEVGPPLDMIADRDEDVRHGTVDFDDDIENFDLGDIIPFDAFNDNEDEDFDTEEEEDDFDYDFDPEDLMDDDDVFTLEPGDDSNEFSIDLTQDDDESNYDEFNVELGLDVDDEDVEPIMEQVNKSLDMFKRFKKHY
jgi:hypothetical protein